MKMKEKKITRRAYAAFTRGNGSGVSERKMARGMATPALRINQRNEIRRHRRISAALK